LGWPARTSIPLLITGVAAASLDTDVLGFAAVDDEAAVVDVVTGDLLMFGEVLLCLLLLLFGLRLITLEGVLLFLSDS
jgi:hypothetical protein